MSPAIGLATASCDNDKCLSSAARIHVSEVLKRLADGPSFSTLQNFVVLDNILWHELNRALMWFEL